jgi:Tfp pilus assembly protein PilF
MKALSRISISVLIVLFLTVGLSYGQNTAWQFLTKGVEHAAEGKFKEAREAFEKTLKDDPDRVSAKRGLKVIEDIFAKKIDKELAIHFFKGLSYELKGQLDNAIDEYSKAIEINPRFAEAYRNRGYACAKEHNYNKAISDYTKAIEINPRDFGAYNERGNAYFLKGQYAKAISDWTKAILIKPRSSLFDYLPVLAPLIIFIAVLYILAKYIGTKLLYGNGKKDKLDKKLPDFSNLPVKISRWKLGKKQTIEISRDLITVTEKGLFANNWSEPVSTFTGTLREKYTVRHGDSGSKTYHKVELVHPDEDKAVPIYKAREEKGIRRLSETAARALNLPVLEKTNEGIVTRAPEDLDKSIRDLGAEGKISVDFDPNATPPKGIEWGQIKGDMSVTLSWGANEVRGVATFGVICFASLVLLFAIYTFGSGKGFIVGLVFLFILTIWLKEWFLDFIGKRLILITKKEVSYFRKTPFLTFNRKVIPLQELETVELMKSELVMESDETKILIGRLGEQQQHWLRNFIRYAVIG